MKTIDKTSSDIDKPFINILEDIIGKKYKIKEIDVISKGLEVLRIYGRNGKKRYRIIYNHSKRKIDSSNIFLEFHDYDNKNDRLLIRSMLTRNYDIEIKHWKNVNKKYQKALEKKNKIGTQ